MSHTLNSGERISEEFDYNSFVEQRSSYRFEILKILESCKDFKGKKLVDCASGEGYGCDLIKTEIPGLEVIGVDLDPDAVSHSSKKYNNLLFKVGSILNIEEVTKSKTDFFISNQTFEHLSSIDQSKALDNVYEILKENGICAIAVPNKPVYELYTPNNPYHLNELDVESLQTLLNTKKWSKLEVYGQQLPSYQRNSMLRKSKILAVFLSYIPRPVIRLLQNFFIPKISDEEIVIEPYNQSNCQFYKILIAFCYK